MGLLLPRSIAISPKGIIGQRVFADGLHVSEISVRRPICPFHVAAWLWRCVARTLIQASLSTDSRLRVGVGKCNTQDSELRM